LKSYHFRAMTFRLIRGSALTGDGRRSGMGE
jgi:hypothetical protein